MVLARDLPESTTMHGLYSTESIKMQHNQLLEFDGFGVVRVNHQHAEWQLPRYLGLQTHFMPTDILNNS